MTKTMISSAVRLSDLMLSPLNVRQTEPDKESMIGLAASIASVGLIQPLVVHALKKPKGKYGVLAGGRRFAALCQMQLDGAAFDFDAVPAVIATGDDAELAQVSLTENVAREAMTDVDIYRTVKALKEKRPKATSFDLAQAYGVPVARMERILRLAFIHPEIFELYAAGKINSDQLRAFGATDDQARQKEVLDERGTNFSAYYIRQALGVGDRNVTDMLKIVTLETYQAAGGNYSPDLFGDGGIVDNPALLTRLFAEVVEAKVALEAPGRFFADSPPQSRGYTDYSLKAYSQRAVSNEVYAEKQDLDVQLQNLWEELSDATDWDEVEDEDSEAIVISDEGPLVDGTDLERIAEARKLYRETEARLTELDKIIADAPEIYPEAATTVTADITNDGKIRLEYWYPDAKAAGKASSGEAGASESKPAEPAAARDPAQPMLTQRAIDWVRAERSNTMRRYVLSDEPDVTFVNKRATDALIYNMARYLVQSYSSSRDDGLVIGAAGAQYLMAGCATAAVLPDESQYPCLYTRTGIEGFALFEAMSGAAKEALAAYVFAAKCQPEWGANVDTIAADVFSRLALPEVVRKVWTPSAAMFDLFKKDTVLAWIKAISIDAFGDWSNRKVAEIKEKAVGFFDGTNPWTGEDVGQSKWVPDFMLWRSKESIEDAREARLLELADQKHNAQMADLDAADELEDDE